MQIPVHTGELKISLVQAIMIYAKRTNHGTQPVYATINPVQDNGKSGRENFQVMPGVPLTKEGIIESLGAISETFLGDVDLFPEHLLSASPRHLLWWRPASKTRVFFKNKEIGKRSAIVPHPALVFAVVGKTWQVWALKDSVRPSANTKLYRAPYFNVDDNGVICAGSANVPKETSASAIQQWEKGFFNSEFTHTNGARKSISYKDGDYSFWKKMLDGDFQEFPTDLLIDRKSTLKSALGEVRHHLESQHG